MLDRTKNYEVADWFVNRIAEENHIRVYNCDVFAILKETEKAAYCMLNLYTHTCRTVWVPKSLLSADGVKETHFISDYDTALAEFHSMWNMYC